MMSPRAELAQRLLKTMAAGLQVSFPDAIQLRNWSVCPEDCVLPLEELALHILDQEKPDRGEVGGQRRTLGKSVA